MDLGRFLEDFGRFWVDFGMIFNGILEGFRLNFEEGFGDSSGWIRGGFWECFGWIWDVFGKVFD